MQSAVPSPEIKAHVQITPVLAVPRWEVPGARLGPWLSIYTLTCKLLLVQRFFGPNPPAPTHWLLDQWPHSLHQVSRIDPCLGHSASSGFPLPQACSPHSASCAAWPTLSLCVGDLPHPEPLPPRRACPTVHRACLTWACEFMRFPCYPPRFLALNYPWAQCLPETPATCLSSGTLAGPSTSSPGPGLTPSPPRGTSPP